MPRKPRTSRPVGLTYELEILGEISSLVQESTPQHASFECILKQLGKIVDYRSASLFTISLESGSLKEVCSIGRKVDLIDFVKFDMGQGISAWVAKQKRPILLSNLRKSVGGAHTRSFLSVPIMFARQVTGVINLAHDEPNAFTSRDTALVGIASSLLALLVERISTEKALALKDDQIRSLLSEVESAKRKLTKMEKLQAKSSTVAALNRKLTNPLAIIAGNAQFLLMTMKNSNTSILKRLKAIDKEAANLMSITEELRNTSAESRKDMSLKL